MAHKKAHEVEGWLRNPDDRYGIVLVYGPDRGLVSERASLLAGRMGLALDDPFSVVRFDASELDREPGRLGDEVRMVPMFSRRRLIWIRDAGAQKGLAEEVRQLGAAPLDDALVLVEAGELRKGSALRAAVEGAACAMALPCYADEGKALDGLIDEALQRSGLSMTLEARQALKRNLGGDRLASRGEIEKLVLYSSGRGAIDAEAVAALTGDVSAVSADDAVDAVLSGDPVAFDAAFARLVASGGPVFPVLSSAMRQFQAIAGLRARMDAAGVSAAAAVAGARPPVFFARRRLVETTLLRLDSQAVRRVLERLHEAVLETRRNPALAVAIARRTLLALALDINRRGR